MKRCINSKLLRATLLASMIVVAGCGGNNDDDDDDVTIIFPEQQQREEGPVPTSGTTIINNNIDNDVRVINKNYQVVENNLIIKYRVVNVDPVVHQQNIYVAPNCSSIRNDLNGDQIIDQAEVEQAVGQPIATLGEAQGPAYETNQQIPLSQLPADQEKFVLVVYGSEEGATIPIICNSFNVNNRQTNTTNTTTPTRTTTTGTGGVNNDIDNDIIITDPAEI